MIAWLNTFGLIANVAGVILLFRFAMPFRMGNIGFLLGAPGDADGGRVSKKYKVYAAVGLVLVIFGTILQINAIWSNL